ncbi:heme anaerobic degradation radical SAM methyltransferase ChuW/HutW [Achromobacter sp. F4_2707]|uniref:heme anaerobic degradation radical SAM methyltransferase ChuW/HutW n=1 Tax=Achromobacter sp. F4_2707 TaxID=3114286 RepID=UPI0039C5F0D4
MLNEYFARYDHNPLRNAFAVRRAVLPWRNKRAVTTTDAAGLCTRLHQEVGGSSGQLAYIHVPFCANHCLFCGFYRYAHTPAAASRYAKLLAGELALGGEAAYGSSASVDALYFGGGTPSALSAQDLERVLIAARRHLPLADDCEITLEGRITHFDDEKIDACLAAGVNRISIGVQSFDTDVRRRQGRKSKRGEVLRFLEGLRSREGFALVIDLLYGLPGQTPEVWRQDLAAAIALEPDGIDLYGLNLIPGSPLHKAVGLGKFPALGGLDTLGEMYDTGARTLAAAGWEQLSNSHWRRTKLERNRYNLQIKQGRDCLAFGAGGGGSVGMYSYAVNSDLEVYEGAVSRGAKPIAGLWMADVLHPLRCAVTAGFEVGQLDFATATACLDEEVKKNMISLVKQWQSAGLLDWDEGIIRLTLAGRFWYSNLIFAFDALLSEALSARKSTKRSSIVTQVSNLQALQAELAKNPGGILEALAAQYGVSQQAVVEALPQEMRTRVAGSAFVDVMQDLAGWGKMTVIVHTPDVIIECHAAVPTGKLGHGFYNLQGGDGPLSGHLRPERCGAIYFVRRPFMGKETRSVQFFNADGDAMFKVYVGRDEGRELKSDQVERFNELERKLTVQEVA